MSTRSESNRPARRVSYPMRVLILLAAGIIGCVGYLWPKVLWGAAAIIAGPVVELVRQVF